MSLAGRLSPVLVLCGVSAIIMGCVSGARPKLPQCDSAVGLPASAGQHQALPVRVREKQCEAGIEGIGRPDREGVARMLDLRSEGLRRIACSIVNLTGPRHIAPLSNTCKLVHAWYYHTFDEQLDMESDEQFKCCVEKNCHRSEPLHGEPGFAARAPLHGEPAFAAWSYWSPTRLLSAVLRRWKWSVAQFSATVLRVLSAPLRVIGACLL